MITIDASDPELTLTRDEWAALVVVAAVEAHVATGPIDPYDERMTDDLARLRAILAEHQEEGWTLVAEFRRFKNGNWPEVAKVPVPKRPPHWDWFTGKRRYVRVRFSPKQLKRIEKLVVDQAYVDMDAALEDYRHDDPEDDSYEGSPR